MDLAMLEAYKYAETVYGGQPVTDDIEFSPEYPAAEFAPGSAAEAPGNLEIHDEGRDKEVYGLRYDRETGEVHVNSDITLETRQRVTHPADIEYIKDLAESLEDKTIVNISATMEGGGVAMILPVEVDSLRKLGVDAHWFVMEPQEGENPYLFTKQMHNVAQRKSDKRISEDGKALHRRYTEHNFKKFSKQDEFKNADIFVIHDPQPAAMIRQLQELNPNAKFIFRNHIDTSGELMADPATPQGEVAGYLLDECGVRDVDAVITHPVDEFSFQDEDMALKTYYAPATLDMHDNLNRKLNPEEVQSGIEFINDEIRQRNEVLVATDRQEDVIAELDVNPSKKRLTLVARFDPSKGMDVAMHIGVLVREKMREQGAHEADLPEIVLVGNGSVDDPDGPAELEKALKLRREKYPTEKDGIIIARLSHNYDAINALMSRSSAMMQTSYAEGMETRISDAIIHGRPVVASNRGGMKTQIVEGESGMILDYDLPDLDIPRAVDYFANLLSDEQAYQETTERTRYQADRHNVRNFTTVSNLARFMRVYAGVLNDRQADRKWEMGEITGDESVFKRSVGPVAVRAAEQAE